MQASETKFQKIIEGTNQYVVPLFQRAYSWDKKQWEDLWNDLVSLIESDETHTHFIGSIVTIPTNSVPEGVSKFLLIDGQQRLTTIFVLLALLRDLAKTRETGNLPQKIEQKFLINNFEEGEDWFKLMPTQVDRAAFKAIIENELPNDGRIAQCYHFFKKKLKRENLDLDKLFNVITTKLSIVSIVLERDDNPHIVFESLNAKGEPLSHADLIRNYFFMRVHVREQDEIHRNYWLPMQEKLGESLTEGIRHYLMRDGTNVRQTDVYQTLKNRADKRDVLETLREVATFAEYYQKLLRPETEPNLELREALTRLKRLEITITYPFLLNCYEDYVNNRISVVEFVSVIKTLENFIVRRFVCGKPTHGLNKIFTPLYKQVRDKAELQSIGFIESVRSALQNRSYPKNSEFREHLINSKIYGSGDRRRNAQFLLETLENAYKHKEKVLFDAASIEHIMPQTPTGWWHENLGESWQTSHELYLHTLGNLTLTGYNSEMSNKPFPVKQQELIKSHFELNRYFLGIQDWNFKAIETRADALADLALQVWNYFGDEDANETEIDSVTGKKPIAVNFLGNRFTVQTWRDVAASTLEAISEHDTEMFLKIADEYPRFVTKNPHELSSPRKLQNDYFIEVHLSAQAINRFCRQSIETIGFSSEDWFIETQ